MKPWLFVDIVAASLSDAPLLLQTKTELHNDEVFGAPDCWEHSLSCWDCRPHGGVTKEVFYLHIPKTAGCSAVADLSRMVGRQNLFSYETCYPWAAPHNFSHSFVMFRRPRDHMLSAYEFCKVGGAQHHPISFLLMPKSFEEWLQKWKESPSFGNFLLDHRFACVCPYNLQTARLVCGDFYGQYCHEKPDIELALQHMKSFSAVGITEAYQESMCLFEYQLTQQLPAYCHCKDPTGWASAQLTFIHEEGYSKGVDDYEDGLLEILDDMTQLDRHLYKAAVQRFIEDLEQLEKKFSTRILCDGSRSKLHAAAGIA